MMIASKMWPLLLLTRSCFDLAWWPSFLLQVTKFQSLPRNYQYKHFEQDSWWLLHKFDHQSVNKVLHLSSRQTFWARFMMIASKIWPLEWQLGFLLIWPGDLVFDPKWPSFEPDLKLIKTNILSKVHDDCFKNVTARVLPRFSFDLAWCPSFWSQVTQFQIWPRNHQDKHFEQGSWWLLEKCDC